MVTFHHNDLDGYCSAAIIFNKYPKCRFIKMNYNKDLPIDEVKKDEEVYVVDFSFQKPGDWEKLLEKGGTIHWIDHHKSAIEKWPNLNYLSGKRDIKKAACRLTWEYIFPDKQVPKSVLLTEDYDIWKWEMEDTEKFHYGMDGFSHKPKDKIWEQLLINYLPHKLEEVIRAGEYILHATNNRYESQVRATAFPVNFYNYNCIVCNAFATGSKLFDSIKKDYDIKITFNFDGESYCVSLYSNKEQIDVSKIAMEFGGGGHRGAAGFYCPKLPFKKIKKGVSLES